ncbi:MAG: GNAT family N-acetyltransferase [bacterium]|nr:GNAT family N-acetyltransferase [bacterium]
MNIRKAKATDLIEIENLNKKYFHESRDFKEILENEDDYFFIVEEKDKIIGFSGIHYNDWNNTVRIIDIFVLPEYRGKGCSDNLIKKIKLEAKKLKVRTIIAEAPSLNNALATYFRNDFRVCGFNDRYYSNDAKEIAIFLSFDLAKK